VSRHKDRPYKELGDLLEGWRLKHARSALSFFNERGKKFDFSYSTYAEFESGVRLPTPANIVSLANELSEDPATALLTWARVQMPSPELKKIFITHRRAVDMTPAKPLDKTSPKEAPAHAPTFENTWVFGPLERQAFEKSPWLWDGVIQLCTEYPNAIDEAKLPRPPKGRAWAKELAAFVSSGRIRKTNHQYTLAHPHIHVPRNAEWHSVRDANFKLGLDNLLSQITFESVEAGTTHRELVSRALSIEQVRSFVTRIKEFEAEFKALPYSNQEPVYGLAIALGPKPVKGE
jgi:hypothetical protein